MVNSNIYIHGVPHGHDVSPKNNDINDWLTGFYSSNENVKEDAYMQIEIANGFSLYTYLRRHNIISAINRPGSYFGISVKFEKSICTSVYQLYELLDLIYKKVCLDTLIKKEGETEKFIVNEIESATYQGTNLLKAVSQIFSKNSENLRFEDIKGFSPSKNKSYFSLEEVDSPIFFDILKHSLIKVSPFYDVVRKDFNKKIEELEQSQADNRKLISKASILETQLNDLANKNQELLQQKTKSENSLKQALTESDKSQKQIKEKYKKVLEEKNNLEATLNSIYSAAQLHNEKRGRKEPHIEKDSHKEKKLKFSNQLLLLCQFIIIALLLFISFVSVHSCARQNNKKQAEITATKPKAETAVSSNEKK